MPRIGLSVSAYTRFESNPETKVSEQSVWLTKPEAALSTRSGRTFSQPTMNKAATTASNRTEIFLNRRFERSRTARYNALGQLRLYRQLLRAGDISVQGQAQLVAALVHRRG